MYNYHYLIKFNSNLIQVRKELLETHITIHKVSSNIITNDIDFYRNYPNFNIKWYKLFNEDLCNFTNLNLQLHYHIYGKNENRIYNNTTFHQKYPNFQKHNKLEIIEFIHSNLGNKSSILYKKIYVIINELKKNFLEKYSSIIANKIKNEYIKFWRCKFNYKFYKENYIDVIECGYKKYEGFFHHWLIYGIPEGRKSNLPDLQKFYHNEIKNNEQLINNYTQNIKNNKIENKINILIRTTYRPDYFNKCIQSVLEQEYSNYHILICYDDPNCLTYLEKYKNTKLEYFIININSKEKYKYNLYCNKLLEKVKEGWIMFLDDDDMLFNNKVLKIINDNITNEEDLLIWQFLRPDRIIEPRNINDINLGEIDSTSFLFHSKYKNKSQWISQRGSDYHFISQLIKNFNFSIKKIPLILTSTNYDNKIANYGK